MIQEVYSFNERLDMEHSSQERADNFYRSLGFTDVRRADYNTPDGRIEQRKDIDATLTYKNGQIITVSEKFREKDWGDILIEISSVFEKAVPGWALTGTADRLIVFFPKRVVIIDHSEVKDVADFLVGMPLVINTFKQLISENKRKLDFVIPDRNGNMIKVSATRAQNEGYNTMSVALPMSFFKNVKIYDKV